MAMWEMAEWETTRARGLVSFVVRFGLLRAGPIYALGSAVLRYVAGNTGGATSLWAYATSTWALTQVVATWLLFGVSLSAVVWYLNEARFRRRGAGPQ